MTTTVPTTSRVRLTGMPPVSFQHPMDKQAAEQLKKMRGFDFLVTKFIEFGIEKIAYVRNVGSSIRVGERQMPSIYKMLLECCDILDVAEPELYVQEGRANAYTSGHTRPHIVLQSDLLDLLDDDELMFVIAHELGHIKCGHVLYKMMAQCLTPLLNLLPVGGPLIGHGVRAAFYAWDRSSEFSADRAGLLTMQEAKPCMSGLMKIAGGSERWMKEISLDEFLVQAKNHHESLDQSLIDKFYHFFVNSTNTHPFMIDRARSLDEWIAGTEYNAIIDYAKLQNGSAA